MIMLIIKINGDIKHYGHSDLHAAYINLLLCWKQSSRRYKILWVL